MAHSVGLVIGGIWFMTKKGQAIKPALKARGRELTNSICQVFDLFQRHLAVFTDLATRGQTDRQIKGERKMKKSYSFCSFVA